MRVLVICMLCITSYVCPAQKAFLSAVNDSAGTAYLFGRNDLVYISYKGYLGQNESGRYFIHAIDSSGLYLRMKARQKNAEIRHVLVEDIEGIRHVNQGIDLLKSCGVLALSVGAIVLAHNAGFNTYQSFAFSGIVGVLTLQLQKHLVTQEKFIVDTRNGWYFKYIML